MTTNRFRTSRLCLIGFIVVLVLTWFCYRPALSGAFQLDDVSNLAGLANVEDASSATDFLLSGTAGPTGRPLSLLTFALQAGQWEQGASAFLRVNILIHLINALLVAACIYQLSVLRAVSRDNAVIVASATASMWVIMPLLATASLFVVQRMTTLSAMFSLLGLGAYLLARSRIVESPNRALTGMSIGVIASTLLATLSKESGLLLPVFILVLELTVLDRPSVISDRKWRIWCAIFLLLPTLAIFAYLGSRMAYPEWLIVRRDFNAWERLLTEAQLLWLYLQKALLGFPARLGNYQLSPEVSRSLFEPLAFVASVAWLALVAASFVWRRRYPLFALAVLWYLAGHLIESTVVPLELYFEHRNYLPMIGPLFALCSFLLIGPAAARRLGVAVVPFYVLLSAYFLYSFASLSGEASLASRYWALRYPDSVRAVATMATYQLAEEGPVRTLSTIDQFVIERPQFAYLRIQELNIRCIYLPDEDHGLVLEQLRRELPTVEFTYTAATMLSQLFSTTVNTSCKGVDYEIVVELAETLRGNSRFRNDPLYNQFHHKLLAGIARQQGNYDATIDHLRQAIALSPSSELNMMMVTALGGAGDHNGANAFIDSALDQLPANPLRAVAWRRELNRLRDYIGELERYSESQQLTQPGEGQEKEEL